jgi:AraC family transcriptional regulator of adaptative response / DNA-3-methyladenine glycosylase II
LLAKTGLHPQKKSGLSAAASIIERMSLDFAECDRARLARDAAYDGLFYTGVHTTGIYCHPVCPVRPARSANVSFFPSAAAAETAGFRPCLRCRPETAPFCSAWIGSRAIVERALRLIAEEGALDQEGATVERLAQRLGVGSRQLTRLFARYLRASPSEVARTARVQRAKRLLDQTSLPMTEIAMRAGFGSLRRFNSVFAEIYGRPPTEIRSTHRVGRGRHVLRADVFVDCKRSHAGDQQQEYRYPESHHGLEGAGTQRWRCRLYLVAALSRRCDDLSPNGMSRMLFAKQVWPCCGLRSRA